MRLGRQGVMRSFGIWRSDLGRCPVTSRILTRNRMLGTATRRKKRTEESPDRLLSLAGKGLQAKQKANMQNGSLAVRVPAAVAGVCPPVVVARFPLHRTPRRTSHLKHSPEAEGAGISFLKFASFN
jgi:hypothetical protein